MSTTLFVVVVYQIQYFVYYISARYIYELILNFFFLPPPNRLHTSLGECSFAAWNEERKNITCDILKVIACDNLYLIYSGSY